MKHLRDQRGLPLYNTARGTTDAVLLEPPPFIFPGVTARVFPLQASVNLLRNFYQSYLNVAPEICMFRPSLPWVFLVVLDYGRMAAEATNLGWVSQHEIFFAVPLEEWRFDRPGGRPVFRGWVLNTPFIFVDNPTSITVGREVYGWPKVLAQLRKTRGKWLRNPCDPTRLLSLDVKGFGSQQSDSIRLLDIDQRLNQNMSLIPLDLKAIDPFKRLSRWMDVSLSAGLDLAQLLVRSPLSGFGPNDPEADCVVLSDSLRQLFSFLQEPGMEAVTLKQFPDAHDPSQICYESLVSSHMGVARYNRGGLLGLPNILQGESSGGFRIRLHQEPAFPIVQSLGLKMAREQTIDGTTVSVLEPVFPFWLDVDLDYGKGRSICWRMLGTRWFRKRTPVGPLPRRSPYNTFAGAGQQVWSGPFSIPRAYWNVFPLRADKVTLCRFIDRYLNLDEHYYFKPWGSHVYMIASMGRMFSEHVSAAWIDAHQIAFVVPLLCFKQNEYKQKELIGTAAVTPFSFCDNPTLTMTQQEVQGVPTIEASIQAVPRFWRHKKPPMLKMRLDVFTALDQGLELVNRKLLEIVRCAPPKDWSPPPCDPVNRDLVRRHPWDTLPLHMLSLKQFRDAAHPKYACYQALVLEPWLLSKPRRVERLKPGTAVKIFRYPSIPLAETLGLCSDSVVYPKVENGAIADIFHADNPFRIELPIQIKLATAIARTAGSLPWEKNTEVAHELPQFRPETGKHTKSPQELITCFLEYACPPGAKGNDNPVKKRARGRPSEAGRPAKTRPRQRP